jgi:perosamine synthetase
MLLRTNLERFDSSELKIVEQVILSGRLSRFFMDFKGGEFVQGFEKDFADYIGCKYAVSVSNGTTALEVALAAIGIRHGDEVITTPLSFVATGTAILRVGATPVFADIKKDTLNIDPYHIEDAISLRTKVILPVSLNGMPCDYKEILDLADKVADVVVLEDAAQSLGASVKGQKVGSFAHVSTFSFQESKTMTTLGEGGMIVTDDPRIYERALNIRNHGNIYGTMTDVICTNARMTEAQAAFGIMQLRKLDEFNKIQTENAEYFLTHLPLHFRPVYNYPLPNGIEPSYYLMPVVAEGVDRDWFLQHMTVKKNQQFSNSMNQIPKKFCYGKTVQAINHMLTLNWIQKS